MATPEDRLPSPADQDARGLVRRIVLGLSSQGLTLSSAIVRSFVVVPFFLAAHGIDGYADWVKLMSLSLLLQLVTLGQSVHYGYRIRTARAQRDHAALNLAIADANAFFLWLYVVAAVGLSGLLLLVDLQPLLHLAVVDRQEAAIILLLLTASSIGQDYRDTLRHVYMAYGELARSDVIQSLAHTLVGILAIAALLLDASMIVIALIYVIVVPGFVSLSAIWDFRRYSEVEVGLSRCQPEWTRRRLRHLAAHSLPEAANMLLLQGPTMLFGVFGIGSEVVVQYHLTRTAMTLVEGRRIAMVFAIEQARQRVQQDERGFRRLHRRSAMVMGIFGGALFAGTMGLWDLFLPFWTRGKTTADMTLAGLMAGRAALSGFGAHSLALLRFGGMMPQVARCHVAAGLVFGALAVPMLVATGIYGLVVLLLLITTAFLYLWPATMVRRVFGGALVVGVVLPLGFGIATAAVVYAILIGGRSLLGV